MSGERSNRVIEDRIITHLARHAPNILSRLRFDSEDRLFVALAETAADADDLRKRIEVVAIPLYGGLLPASR